MTTKSKQSWFVARRGELLAEEFLLEFGPDGIFDLTSQGLFDYLALFSGSDGTPIAIAIAIEVTATEQLKKENFKLPTSKIEQLRKSNIPVLLIVIDVKQNHIFFNWIKSAISNEELEQSKNHRLCQIELREATPQEKEKLRNEIFDFAEVPA